MSEKPLFIPLKGEYFDAFERGDKDTELRPYGPRWNERTCRVGRAVTLSRGYGKARRLSGQIVGFEKTPHVRLAPNDLGAWLMCYGSRYDVVAAIQIKRVTP